MWFEGQFINIKWLQKELIEMMVKDELKGDEIRTFNKLIAKWKAERRKANEDNHSVT